MYEFQIHLTEQDYDEFNDHYLMHSPLNRRTVHIIRLLVPLAFACVLVFYALQGEDLTGLIVRGVLFAIVSVVLGYAVWPIQRSVMRHGIRTMKKRGTLPFDEEAVVRFDADAVTQTTSNAESKMKYERIERVETGKTAVYLFINAVQAYIIPFTAFSPDAQREDFLAFIREKAPNAKIIDS